jgi:hypothetical protein
MRLYERALRTDRPAIKLLGLFDTVSSVFASGQWIPSTRPSPSRGTIPALNAFAMR